jgi:hypothetical protein
MLRSASSYLRRISPMNDKIIIDLLRVYSQVGLYNVIQFYKILRVQFLPEIFLPDLGNHFRLFFSGDL